jgi:hypothetical protein
VFNVGFQPPEKFVQMAFPFSKQKRSAPLFDGSDHIAANQGIACRVFLKVLIEVLKGDS